MNRLNMCLKVVVVFSMISTFLAERDNRAGMYQCIWLFAQRQYMAFEG